MTIKDYRPKDYVWFEHRQAVEVQKRRPGVVLRVFPALERVVLLYGQSKPWPEAILVSAGAESPFPGDTYFAANNVCTVAFTSLHRVSVPPKTCKTRLFLAFEALAERRVMELLHEEDLVTIFGFEP